MDIEKRLARVERQCRWYRNLFVLAGLMVVALLTYGATKPIPRVIKAQSFEVVDSNGVTLVFAASDKNGAGFFAVLDSKGTPGIAMAGGSGDKEVPSINIYNGGLVNVWKGNSKRVSLGGSSASGLLLMHNNKLGLAIFGPKESTSGGRLAVYNKTGERIVDLRADEYGNGVVGAYNRKGIGRELKPGPQ